MPALRMPGAILMTRLRVYDTPTPDGQLGGTPHMHLVCSEMYVVLAGSGAVETIDQNGFARVELNTHDALLFTPGTLHRLINPHGNLEILVIMQNSGLPERGDNVVCFSEEHLASDEAYAAAMRVTTLDEAYQRRDRGVTGFLALKTQFEQGREQGCAALQRFFAYAEARTAAQRPTWQTLIEQGALTEAQTSLAHLQALQAQQFTYLAEAQQHKITTPDKVALGFCGHLNRYFDPATLTPEGIRQS